MPPSQTAQVAAPGLAMLRNLAYLNLWLPLGMAALTAAITSVMGATVQAPAAAVAFLSFFAIYTLDHVLDRAADLETHRDRAEFSGQYRNALLAAALTAQAGAVAIAWPFGWGGVGMAMVPLVAVTFYSLIGRVRLAGRALPRLKDITGVKNIVVASVLAIVPVGLPVALSPGHVSGPVWPIVAILFGRFLINAIVFDLRDTLGDRRNAVRTLPVVFGPRRVLRGLHGLNLSLLPATLLAALWHPPLVMLTGATVYSAWYLTRWPRSPNKSLLCDVAVDGEMLLWAALLAIGLSL